MAKRSNAKKSQGNVAKVKNGATVGYEAELWQMADTG
jgi:hypothetical protein